MSVQLKPIEDQVIVITGATSGIGLTTARMAAERGARVVLAARSEDELESVVEEIREAGGEAEYVVADVSDREAVQEIADTAEEVYGGFDTWVNVAGVFIYGTLEETPIEDMREQFDVNVWGLLYGSLEAAKRLKARGEDERGRGGAIVNLGSIVSDRAFPLQGSYSASKHAVKGFTDALRVELEEEGAPVSVTLLKPSAIDTPYAEHAKNYMDTEATLPPPLYAPEVVARTILDAAERPRREVTVGGGGKVMTALARLAPGLLDTVMEKLYFDLQRTDRPAKPRRQNALDEPAGETRARGDYDRRVRERSLYTAGQRRSMAPLIVGGLVVAVATVYALTRDDDETSDRSVRRESRSVRDGLAESESASPSRVGLSGR